MLAARLARPVLKTPILAGTFLEVPQAELGSSWRVLCFIILNASMCKHTETYLTVLFCFQCALLADTLPIFGRQLAVCVPGRYMLLLSNLFFVEWSEQTELASPVKTFKWKPNDIKKMDTHMSSDIATNATALYVQDVEHIILDCPSQDLVQLCTQLFQHLFSSARKQHSTARLKDFINQTDALGVTTFVAECLKCSSPAT